MSTAIFKPSILIITAALLISCTKEVPKELINNQKPGQNQQQQMPDDSIHRNIGQNQNDTKGDNKADEMMKAADDAETEYIKTKSEADKKICIQKQLDAANYLMFKANLSPKKKYRPALQRYRKVLELDPKNSEALENKKQIEDIYQSMGMPIPD
jgi:tetratricopeptide (TPR) repeat protein